jgi:hypothetical protein
MLDQDDCDLFRAFFGILGIGSHDSA